MMAEKSPIFAFDDVRVELRAFKAWKNGHEVPLEPKTFHVLLFLIEHRGRLIEKNELLEAVWKENCV
ncbi:MAG: winged helix-turn-helix domain-containing protein [Acidobacteria bacterium]|nr:winged helix-turn-helix domain-containing protein [Acidobacteriota bacterium]